MQGMGTIHRIEPDPRGAGQTYDTASPQGGYTPRFGPPERPYGEATSRAIDAAGGHGSQADNRWVNSQPPPPVSQMPSGVGGASGLAYNDAYRPQSGGGGSHYGGGQRTHYVSRYDDRHAAPARRWDHPEAPRSPGYADRRDGYDDRYIERRESGYSSDEILTAGHRFFGSISQGLAQAVENLFRRQGRPNGYILGEEAGGAFVAGLRYGEGYLYTRDAGTHRVFWQGPSIGFDAGAAGSKVMVLVYNLRDPSEIYDRFGGVDGSAYVVGGVGVTLQKKDHITLAPIRSGIGLRLGANVGYLKYTPRPTWNPF